MRVYLVVLRILLHDHASSYDSPARLCRVRRNRSTHIECQFKRGVLLRKHCSRLCCEEAMNGSLLRHIQQLYRAVEGLGEHRCQRALVGSYEQNGSRGKRTPFELLFQFCDPWLGAGFSEGQSFHEWHQLPHRGSTLQYGGSFRRSINDAHADV